MLDARYSTLLLAAATNAALAASSTGVGDYVASAIGETVSSTTTSLAPTDVVAEGLVTVNNTVYTATLLEDGEIEVGNITIYPSSYSSPTPRYTNSTTIPTLTTDTSLTSTSQQGTTSSSTVDKSSSSSKASNITPSRFASSAAKPVSRSKTLASSGLPAITTKPTNGSSDDCYSSWSVYWSASQASYDASATYDSYAASSLATGTSTGTYTEIYDAQPATTQTNYYTEIYTSYEVDGGFTLSTSVVDTTSTYYNTYSSEPASTYIYTFTSTEYSVASPPSVSVPPMPTCSLGPSAVSSCNQEWSAWLNTQLAPSPTPPPHCDVGAGFLNNLTVPACALAYQTAASSYYTYIGGDNQFLGTPACKVASIGGSLCQSVRDNYQMDENAVFWPTLTQGEPFFFNQGTQGLFNGVNTSWIWPTSSTMGPVPSCTLGCGRCAITGGTVQLLYWAASATPTPQSGNFTRSSQNSSQPLASPTPTATGPVTLVTLGTTLTSPTLYISYGSVYAENACGGVGTTIGETILAIPTSSALSSVYAITIPCDAHFRPTQEVTFTAPFTIGDLTGNNGTVPYSIYSSQPVCQTYLRDHGCQGVCPTTKEYSPILVVPDDLLRAMQPAWQSCWGDIRGVYDPPLALTAAQNAAAAANTFTTASDVAPTSTPATPASGPAPTTANPTTIPVPTTSIPTTSAPTVESEVLPSTSNTAAAISILSSALSQQKQSSTQASSVQDPQATPQTAASHSSVAQSATQSAADPNPSQTSSVVATVGSQVFTVSPVGSSSIAVANGASTTVLGLSSVATIGGQQVSIASSGIVVGTGSAASTLAVGSASSDPQVTVLNSGSLALTVSQAGSSSLAIANGGSTTTLAAGAVASLNGQQVSVGNSGTVVVGTGNAVTTFTAPTIASPAQTIATIGSETVTLSAVADGSSVVIAGSKQTTTLAAGAAAATFDGQQVSVATGGSVIFKSDTALVSSSTPAAANTVISVGSQAISLSDIGGSAVIVENGVAATIAPGSVTTINGQQISAGSSGVIVLGTGSAASTLTIPSTAAMGPAATAITVGSQALTISEMSGGSSVVVAENGTTKTIVVGSAVAFGGETISAGSSGVVVVKSGSSLTSITAATIPTTSSSQSTTSRSTQPSSTTRTTGSASANAGPIFLITGSAFLAVVLGAVIL